MGSRVGLGKVGTGARQRFGASFNLDLATSVVELGAATSVALVKRDNLGADQVRAVRKVRKCNSDCALIGDKAVHAPLAVAVAVLVELRPDGALAIALGRSDVDHNRALMRLCCITLAVV